jgi:hypothetical protein
MKLLRFALIYVLMLIVTGVGLAQIRPLPTVPAPSNLGELCAMYAPLEDLNGPNCLNPVWWDMEGFININAVVRYVGAGNSIRVGRVAGYAWHRDENRYYYLLENYNVAGDYVSVAPERIDN